MEKVYRAIGARIRTLRQGLRLTQAEVAERVGIDPSFYGQIERGANTPSLRTLFAVAAVLRVEPADLLPSSKAEGEDRHINAALDGILARLPARKRKLVLGVVSDIVAGIKD